MNMADLGSIPSIPWSPLSACWVLPKGCISLHAIPTGA